MGTWGTGLYQNDITCDVRDSYMEYLREQLSNHEAYIKVIEKYSECIGDEEDEPLLWFALAETQWKVGRLLPEVKAKAIEWMERDGMMALWEESKTDSTGWKKTLNKLHEKLITEQPKEKKIRKPIVINKNLWNVGDIYAYQFNSEESKEFNAYGKYILLQKIGEGKHLLEEVLMRIHVYNNLFDNIPAIEDISGIRLLPFRQRDKEGSLSMNGLVDLFRKADYPINFLTYVGNTVPPANKVYKELYSPSPSAWKFIEKQLSYKYQQWHGVEYEMIEEGVFKYTPSK